MNSKNKIFKLFKRNLKCFIIKVYLILNFFSWFVEGSVHIAKKRFKSYSEKEATKICDEYVLEQKLYYDDSDKNVVDKWSSRYYKNINEYIRGISRPPKHKIEEYELFRKKLSHLIESTEGLKENTILFRGEKMVDMSSRFTVGEINKFSGFISTSFSKKSGKSFSKTALDNGYLIIIKAKIKTKGIAINGIEIGTFKYQNEWLLNENQEYITCSIDYERRIIVIELL